MTEAVCHVCGAADPRYLKHIDSTVADMLHRVSGGFGQDSFAVHFCDDPRCEEAVNRLWPDGNRAALARLRQQPMHENEARLADLIESMMDSGRVPS